MKSTSLIIIIIISAQIFFSCSDIRVQNIPEEYAKGPGSSSKLQSQKKNPIWHHDGIMIMGRGGLNASKEILSNITLDYFSKVLITFEGWTDSDISTYTSQVNLYNINCGDVIFEAYGNSGINGNHEIYVKLYESQVKFRIALENSGMDKIGSNASIKISNINIYDCN